MSLFGKESIIEFTDKKQSIMGIFSSIIGLFSLVLLVVMFFMSGAARGNGGITYGMIGFLDMLLSTGGFIMGILSFRQEDIFLRFPMIGSITNGIIAISYMVLYFVGMR